MSKREIVIDDRQDLAVELCKKVFELRRALQDIALWDESTARSSMNMAYVKGRARQALGWRD